MSYFISIKNAMFLFPIVAILITLPYIISQYHKYGSIHPVRTTIIYSFILYLLCAYFLVILPLPSKEEVLTNPKWMMQLRPFSFVTDFIKETSFRWTAPATYLKAIKEPCIYIVIFNILLTVPFGMFQTYYYQDKIKKIIIKSFLLSLFFELTQLTRLYFIYPRPYRLFDVDDLILNTIGGVLGYFLLQKIQKFFPSKKELDKRSYQLAEKVSGLRRLISLGMDITLYIIIECSIDLNFPIKISHAIVFFIYFCLIPIIWQGKTVASNFLNFQKTIPKPQIIRITGYHLFLYLYYIKVPSAFIQLLPNLKNLNIKITPHITIITITLLIIVIYGIPFLILLKKGELFYDKWFQITYHGTIKEKNHEIDSSIHHSKP